MIEMSTKKVSMIGLNFGKLEVLSEVKERNKNGHILYLCKCKCGLEKEILASKAVRKALELAIDKKEITKAFFDSKLQPAETFLAPTNSQFINYFGDSVDSDSLLAIALFGNPKLKFKGIVLEFEELRQDFINIKKRLDQIEENQSKKKYCIFN